jgi:hypothetical protein
MSIKSMATLLALLPVGALFLASAVLFSKQKTFGSLLQLIGATCLMVVVVTHICEAFCLFPWMHWGDARSVGHYLDLTSAFLGISLFPAGYLVSALGFDPLGSA